MATRTIEEAIVHSTDKEFQAFMGDKVKGAIESILHDALREKGWSPLTLLDWEASFDVTFIDETYEDEE